MKGVGIDLCQVARIEKAMSKRFLQRYYTEEERRYIASRGEMGAESAAAMFAAKEAFLKAVGLGIGAGVEFSEIGVAHGEHGAPCYQLGEKAQKALENRGASSVFLSLSHEAGLAAAFCVIE